MSWPCWMGGDCDQALAKSFSTPAEENASVARWQHDTSTKAQETASASGSINCELGTAADCALPTEADKSRWRRESEQDRISEHNSEVGEGGHMDREIARQNRLPPPKQNSDISEKGAAEVVSDRELQKDVRKDLMHAAMDRVKALSTQVHAIKNEGKGKAVKRSDLHAAGGTGLLSQGPNKAKVLAKFPNSQKKIVGIIHQVQTAQQAKEAAAAAQTKAEQLQQEAEAAQQQADTQAGQAKKALAKAQSKEKKHKLASQDVEMSKNRLMYAHQKVAVAKLQLKPTKVAPSPGPPPLVGKAQQVKNEAQDTLKAVNELKVQDQHQKQELAHTQAPAPKKEMSANEMAQLVREQYALSQRRYRQAQKKTAMMEKIEEANAWIENV